MTSQRSAYPATLGDWQEIASLVLAVCFVVMLAMEPSLWCCVINNEKRR